LWVENIKLSCKKKKLKGTDVFVNKHLNKKNAEIAHQARILKKEKKNTGYMD